MMSFRDDFSRTKSQHTSRHTAQRNTGGRDTTYQRQRDRRSTSSCTQILKNKHFILCSLASVNQDDVLDSAWQKEGWVREDDGEGSNAREKKEKCEGCQRTKAVRTERQESRAKEEEEEKGACANEGNENIRFSPFLQAPARTPFPPPCPETLPLFTAARPHQTCSPRCR